MREMDKIAAVILAAGYSSRMGELKPILPLGEQTVIERVVEVFQKAGIKAVSVVVGYQAQKIMPVLEGKNVKILYNPEFANGMFSSVQTGVESLQHEDVEAFFLIPADYPLVKPESIKKLTETYFANTAKIIYPCYQKVKGHPPIISADLIQEILSFEEEGGLRVLLARHQAEALYLDLDDKFVLMDMDTLIDYEKVLEIMKHR